LKIRNEIKVGVVIVIALGLLYFGVNYLKGSDVFSKSRYFYAKYDRVDGLTRDNPILINGFKVGRVTNIDLIPSSKNQVLVRFEILEDQLLLPKGTIAMISATDLLGSKAIKLDFSEQTEYHNSGDTLAAGMEKEIQTVIEDKLAPLQEQIDKLIEESRLVITSLTETVENSNHAIANADKAITNISSTAVSIDTFITGQKNKIESMENNIIAITSNLRNNSQNITEILQNVASISDSLTRANYQMAIQNATNALMQIDSLMTKINNGEGSLGLLVTDEKLYRNLEQAALEIDKLTEDLRINPERYVHVSVFGKKEKAVDKPKKKDRDENGNPITTP